LAPSRPCGWPLVDSEVVVHFDVLKPALVLGVIQIGLYGFLPIALVLTYRVSRTIAFFHAAIAASAGLVYWILVYRSPLVPGNRPELPGLVGLVLTTLAGAFAGGMFGLLVMSRKVVGQGALALTIISLAAMMMLLGVSTSVLAVESEIQPPGAFGAGTVNIWGVEITRDQFFDFVCVVVLVVVVAAVLTRTRSGMAIRALADDVEAGVWCGVKLHQVGTAVYIVSGAIAALGGALISIRIGPDPAQMLFLFLRGLGVAMIGGMRSLPLALLGAAIYSMLDATLNVGLFGTVSLDVQEVIINGALLLAILVVAKRRREDFFLLERQGI
jgi:branched-subunit amino acid ABC-type transport system permease component